MYGLFHTTGLLYFWKLNYYFCVHFIWILLLRYYANVSILSIWLSWCYFCKVCSDLFEYVSSTVCGKLKSSISPFLNTIQ